MSSSFALEERSLNRRAGAAGLMAIAVLRLFGDFDRIFGPVLVTASFSGNSPSNLLAVVGKTGSLAGIEGDGGGDNSSSDEDSRAGRLGLV